MAHLSRRSVLRGTVAVGATRLLAAPHIAKAAATTASVWFSQGFVQDEDVALRKAVADYEKASGNKIELSITPFAPERQKIIAALTSGVVPDVVDSTTPPKFYRFRLARQVGRRQRRRGDPEGPIQRTALQSPPRATTASPRSAAFTACH